MRRNRFRIRFWLALAVATASLALVASASASLYMGDMGGAAATPAPIVVTTPDNSFNWGDALAGAGVAFAAAVGSVGIIYLARRHRRTGLAT